MLKIWLGCHVAIVKSSNGNAKVSFLGIVFQIPY
jgi:hypothetical protein